uniref:Lipoprotein n=1 Tax=Setaria viridis TaxID=4556 RepID=A0A4U6VJ21_SETVI|nr:hypothetical protein SEVIR_3G259033v2 [Setaria viridis]
MSRARTTASWGCVMALAFPVASTSSCAMGCAHGKAGA